MAFLHEFRCEVCGTVSHDPFRWFVIRSGDAQLSIQRWNDESARASDARHLCGESDAQVYISRWFDAMLAYNNSRRIDRMEAAAMVVAINPNVRLCRDRQHSKADPPSPECREYNAVQRGRL